VQNVPTGTFCACNNGALMVANREDRILNHPFELPANPRLTTANTVVVQFDCHPEQALSAQ
jgi:hypothetical protein